MSATDDATIVRHVGIARTLVERFDELARGPVGAAVLGEALAKVGSRDYDRDGAQQLRTGEASQIFPEIWTNLDTAASALRAAGKPMGSFDAARGAQPANPVGLYPNGDFNMAGARAAREAIGAIEAATPTIDWGAIKQADAALVAEAALALGAGRHKMVAIIGGVLLAVIVIAMVVVNLMS